MSGITWMRRFPSLLEPFIVFSAALILVWGLRLGWGGSTGMGWWLIPFIWIVAACLPGLWTNDYWLTRKGLVGHFSVSLREVIRLSLLVFPLFTLGYLFYFGDEVSAGKVAGIQAGWWMMAVYQIFYVGLSEELFFRGYLQQRLDERFGRPYQLFGARFGGGLLGASLLFAMAHAVLGGSLKNLDVFIPGLLFGWLQARTNATLAPALFHGLSNIVLFTLRDWF